MYEFFVVALFFFFSRLFVVDFNCPLFFRVFVMTPKYEQLQSKSWQVYLNSQFGCVLSKTKRAYCAYCKCELYAKFTDLEKSSQTQKHKKSSEHFL
jgi:hypothetical protein